ncbi:MAG: hypothetical protein A3G32_02835 [Deltaproteobacteria bacterium RIFCSPLOWO2_12_FULL_40_28]|nr:MAG: hypothetical protein A3C45_00215 [Deltaproteobacteria bacterium RIFCSPHIGHO2_02_FULL_40_28]OGQ20051.1 MAG: hypothetical protein A3E27_02880 [Deltaproteobacteria bacterium RIFCSPHIGHO2_12_FULL_40_32]OGQ40618.1 MAG: hypothetical protein A3I69_10305 [Deltaproteobacteria bacterium RIFCSPLOWO2_02_FULL_40_36]OGQ54287.1 MAG: hypothetical protein A3G32_02835 [Deltaproteobacteria bacterium RIFCSPLOWO2_12_FULL_40_28]
MTALNIKTTVVICVGYPSTGKTTSTQRLYFDLANDHQVALLTTLSIRDSLGLMESLHSETDRQKVYNQIVHLTNEKLIDGSQIIILDGNFNKQTRRNAVYELLPRFGAELIIIECLVSGMEEIKERLSARQKNPDAISNKASTMELYNLIKDSSDPLLDDQFPDIPYTLLEYNTETQTLKTTKTNHQGSSILKKVTESLKRSASPQSEKNAQAFQCVKSFLFDIGGVLQSLRWEAVSNELNDLKPDLTMDAFRNALYFEKEKGFGLYETNKISTSEFWKLMAKRLDINPSEAHRLADAFGHLYGPTDSEMIDLLSEIKKSYPLFILSNSCPELEKAVLKNHRFYDVFDHVYFSHRIGYKKPSIESYLYVLEKNNLKPHECVFIDDVAKNVSEAQNLGFFGILYLSPTKLRKTLSPWLQKKTK